MKSDMMTDIYVAMISFLLLLVAALIPAVMNMTHKSLKNMNEEQEMKNVQTTAEKANSDKIKEEITVRITIRQGKVWLDDKPMPIAQALLKIKSMQFDQVIVSSDDKVLNDVLSTLITNNKASPILEVQ